MSAARSAFNWVICLIAFQGLSTAQAASSTIRLKAGDHPAVAEVAVTAQSRSAGLMHRKSLPPNRGMLFVYPEPRRYCMWMRNTPLPLSVAFVDSHNTVVNIAEMRPNSVTRHCADRPVTYSLEMNEGWFHRRGIKQGSRITGLGKAPPAR